jgi:hypothetical protein
MKKESPAGQPGNICNSKIVIEHNKDYPSCFSHFDTGIDCRHCDLSRNCFTSHVKRTKEKMAAMRT